MIGRPAIIMILRRRACALAAVSIFCWSSLCQGFVLPPRVTKGVGPPADPGAARSALGSQTLVEGDVRVAPPGDPKRLREPALIRRFERLPFWPIWNGLLIMLLDTIGLKKLSQEVERRIGGRVSPQIFLPSGGARGNGGLLRATSPFLLMAVHRHSFSSFDPLRFVQRLLIPEGFPAHPHAGFCTLTYVVKGKVRHRDSIGVRQVYGNGAVQFLAAGSGVLHEEMWELPAFSLLPSDIDLIQIWVNVPSSLKGLPPSIQLLDQVPEVSVNGGTGSIEIRVVAGQLPEGLGNVEGEGVMSDLTPGMRVLHCTSAPGAKLRLPVDPFDNLLVYVRKGPLFAAKSSGREECIETFETAFFRRGGDLLELSTPVGGDYLVLSGRPIEEPVIASGPWVAASEVELQQAYAAYERGSVGPWDHKMSDEEWLRLCRSSMKDRQEG